jgi:hypothetical protein
MSHKRFRTPLVAVVLLVACTVDSPFPVAPPDVAPMVASDDGTQRAAALLRKKALATDVTASARIGPEGGSLAIPQVGFRMVVPQGALSASTLVTVRASAGPLVVYEFAPHGTTFAVPVRISQDLGGTAWTKVKISAIEGAYFALPSQLDPLRGEAIIDEFLATSVDPLTRMAGFSITHFSGYILASGRTQPPKP